MAATCVGLFCLFCLSQPVFAKAGHNTDNDQEERLEQACLTLLDTVTTLMEAKEFPAYTLDLYYHRMLAECRNKRTRIHAIEELNSDLLKLGD